MQPRVDSLALLFLLLLLIGGSHARVEVVELALDRDALGDEGAAAGLELRDAVFGGRLDDLCLFLFWGRFVSKSARQLKVELEQEGAAGGKGD